MGDAGLFIMDFIWQFAPGKRFYCFKRNLKWKHCLEYFTRKECVKEFSIKDDNRKASECHCVF